MAEQRSNRIPPYSEPFKKFIAESWAPHSDELPAALPAAAWTSSRRDAVSARFPGVRLVIPAGGHKVRAGDGTYRFRPDSNFAYLTGLGTDREPDATLVLEPDECGHTATLYFRPRAPRTDAEFYSSTRYGEMWVGKRESLAEMAAMTLLRVQQTADLEAALSSGPVPLRILRDADPTLTRLVDELRGGADLVADLELAQVLSELRLVKDDFEIAQIQQACSHTASALEAAVRSFPEAIRRGRGERWVEGVFSRHARHLGHSVGFDTIVAAGEHSNTLHWIRNDGDIHEQDLVLIDAGVELDSLYTADITRTFPASGRFSPAQRMVYDAVLEAHAAAVAAARPGALFREVHQAAITVLAHHLERWGMLPISASEALDPVTGGHHRRWMVHGTSHHLGLDVHDCAQARDEHYRMGPLKPGMVLTVEPGLYIKSTDLLAPPQLRGIGVRIEDDILITGTGCRILSDSLPRAAADVESWMAALNTSEEDGTLRR